MRKILKRITAFALSMLLVCTAGVTDLLSSMITANAATTTYVDGDDVVKEALKLLKTPYVWGGTSTSGMDCSGMVYYVLQKVGINATSIPRDTSSWANAISNGTLALKDSSGNTVSVTVKTYSNTYPSASDVEPGTIILQNGHMSICAGTFSGNTGTTSEYGSNFRLNTLLSVRNSLLSKYGSAISNLSTLLTIDDVNNKHFFMHGSYCEQSTYNSIWRIEAFGNSSNTASNPGKGVALSNSKSDKNGSAIAVATITFNKSKEGKILFTKTSSYTQEAVKGATYAVYPSSMSDSDVQNRGTSNRITTFTTGSDGKSTVSLNAGTYKAIEITAPSGFELSNKVYKVTVSADTTTTQSVTDTEEPFSLRLKKTDSATGKTITGAEFTVYARQEKGDTLPSGWYESPSYYWKPIGKMTYNSSTGYYESGDLYPVEHTSNYLVRETKAQDGYVLDSSWSWEVKVLAPAASYSGILQRVNFGAVGTYQGESGSDVTTVENTPKPITLQLKKTDAATGKTLPGATFTVYEKTEKLDTLPEGWVETGSWFWKPVKDFTYDSTTGYYTASDLQPTADNDGCYRVYETSAPEGLIADTGWCWQVRAMNSEVTYTGGMTRANYGETTTYQAEDGSSAVANTPDTIALKVNKYDSVTGSGLSGAVFTVYERQPKGTSLPEGWKETANYYWKPVTTLTYIGNGEYRVTGLQPDSLNQGYFRVYETAAPEGYVTDTSWHWEVRAMASSATYTGSLTRVDYGSTASYQAADGTTGLNNTPETFGVSIDKRDGNTMAVLDKVAFTVYERQAAGSDLPEGWLSADGYSWKPYAALAYNAATQKYDTIVLADGTTASGLQPTKDNGGHFRIYETAAQNATYVPFDGFWEVAGAATSSMGSDDVQYIKYGTTGVYGQYTDSPYLFNYTDNTDYTVKKTWNDGDNRDGIRPDSVTVTLTASLPDGTPVDLAALTGTGAAAAVQALSEQNVPETSTQEPSLEETTAAFETSAPETSAEAGTNAETVMQESSIEETEASEASETPAIETSADEESQTAETASHGETTTEAAAEAAAVSEENGIAPAAETAADPFTVVLNSANNWQHTFTDLPVRTADGNTIVYSLVEENIPAGYTVTVRKAGTTITAVNTHTPEPVSIPVRKVWDDISNKAGIRPSSVTVRLYADGTEINSVVLDSSNSWNYTFTTDKDGSKLYKNANGTAITYTITEDAVANYTTAITGSAAGGFTVTNSYIPYTSVRVTKTWSDYSNAAGTRPDAVTVRLYADGTEINSAQLTAAQKWTCTFTKDSAGNSLEKYHADGSLVSYTIREDTVTGYNAPVITGSAAAGYTITNTYEEYMEIPVSKVWNDNSDAAGLRPEEIGVRLYADGETINTAKLSAENSWKHTFTVDASGKALPKYHADGTLVEYTMEEYELNDGDLDVYTVSCTGSAEKGFTITNRHLEYVQVPVEKTWDDNSNAAGIRPDSITVYLFADGKAVNSAAVTAADGWKYTFTTDKDGSKLAKYAQNGESIRYTVTEAAVEGYTTDITEKSVQDSSTASVPKDGAVETATGFSIKNTYREYVELSVTKTWNDGNDRDGIRPDSITVYLYAAGEIINTAELSAENSWKHTFTRDADGNSLEKYSPDGSTVLYSISEAGIEGYDSEITSGGIAQNGNTTTLNCLLVNTHNPDTTKIQVNKTWNDSGLDESVRPETITVHLYADGVEVNSAELSAETGWTYVFMKDAAGNDLYRLRDGGTSIIYTVKEDVPEGWMAEVGEGLSLCDFSVSAGNLTMFEIINTPTVLKVSKQDITTSAEVPGAHLEIYAADADGSKTGDALYSWVSTDTPHVISGIPAGDYILVETIAPEADGYIKASNVTFTIEETREVQSVVMKDDYTKVEISKTDITTGKEIPGATLTVTDADGNEIDTWVTDGTPHRIDYLAPGEYTLTEVAAPEEDGYVLAESVPFVVEATGEIQRVQMKDDYTKVEISKTDITTGEEIPGATLTVTDAEGNEMDRWVTDGTPHRIDYLAPGEYTLTEVAAPEEDGYVRAESVTFTVEATGEIQRVEMKDDYTKVEISKTDFVTGKEITGAKLILTDADGITVAEWVTDGAPYRIDYLAPGEYTLTEVTAPDGYEIAESITFTVESTGEIQKVEMQDKPVEEIEDTPETPILGIEDTTGGMALILMALAVFMAFCGMMLYLKKKAEE